MSIDYFINIIVVRERPGRIPNYSMFNNFTTKGTQLMYIYSPTNKDYASKYEKWYNHIILNAKCQIRFKGNGDYYEKHHIIPKSLGGNDAKENLVLLTSREHFVCHWLLYKFSKGPNKAKMAHAWFMMCSTNNKNQKRHKTTSRIYELARLAKCTAEVLETTRKKQSQSQKGKTIPLETRQKISATTKGRAKSEKHRNNLSKSLKGRKKTKEHLARLSESRKGLKWTDEQKQRLKQARPLNGKNNPSFLGWYVTPWGIFDTPKQASDSSPFDITESSIRKYCKYRNNKMITNNHPIRLEYVGKTPKELGFGFKEGR